MASDDDKEFTDKWCKRIAKAWDEGRDQRDAANEDIRFCHVPGGMWEDWMDEKYGYDADRVRMEFDITSDAVNGFLGEWKDNRAGIYFTPDDDATDDDDAEILTGIHRADFNDNGGKLAVDCAVEELAECGVGHFLLSTEFVNPENPEDERQKICWEELYNSYSYVVWPTEAKSLTKDDAKWCVVLTPYSDDDFDATFPDAESKASAFEPYTRRWMDWGSDTNPIIVAELYTIDKKSVTVHVYENIEANEVAAYTEEELKDIKDELRDEGWSFVRERKITKRIVEKTIFNAVEILDETKRIPGKYIPVIPMYAFRKYIDGQERYRGLVRKKKDPNRLLNMSISRMAESSATSPDRVPIFAREQVEGLEDNWADNTGTKPYDLVNALHDKDGNPIYMGALGYTEPSPVDPNTMAAMQLVMDYVQRADGGELQDTVNPEISGKALNAIIKRTNRKNNVITDNINIALEHAGEVWLAMAAEVYVEEMTKRIVSEDGTASTTRINQAIFDRETGKFVASETIKGKQFKVSAEIGVQYETQREATVETLERVMTMVGNESKYFPALFAMWMKNIYGTGLEELKEFNRTEMLKMGMMKPETDEEKQMLQILSQQVDPNAELMKAATLQQQGEAASLFASAQQKQADAQKKQAETAEIISDIGVKRAEIALQKGQRLRYNPQTGMLDSAS